MNKKPSKTQRTETKKSRTTALSTAVVAVFIVLVVVCSIVPPGQLANFIVPVAAFSVASFLYIKSPYLYVDFVLWVSFFAPLVRRFIDYKIGFTNPSPILLTPYVVMLPTAYSVVRYLPRLKNPIFLPFTLAFSGLAYGVCIGLINSSIKEVTISSLEWIPPVTLGWYLSTQWKHYPIYAQHFTRIFLWCVLITGIYGIYQYLFAPAWDVFWLDKMINELNIVTFGNPEPREIRVWSTMHGPLVFAACLSAGILLLVSQRNMLAVVGTIVGLLCLLLTQVRTAWIGLILGLAILMISMKQSLQIRLFLILMIIIASVISLSSLDLFSDVIGTRVSTLSLGTEDYSAGERISMYRNTLSNAMKYLIGTGLTKDSGSDSGLLDIMIRLGWIGGIPYACGLLFLAMNPMKHTKSRSDNFAKAAHAIAICLAFQLPLGAVMIQVQGAILWSFLGMKLAAWRYYTEPNENIYYEDSLKRHPILDSFLS